MKNTEIEVIMAAYNNVRDMRLVFDGYLRQTDTNFTLCVADDGSRPEVKALVDVYRDIGLSIRYLWQEDKGYRRAQALNKAIASSEATYIIMSDNDCLPHSQFIADYRAVLRDGFMFFGRRVDLYAPVSDLIRTQSVSLNQIEKPLWLISQAMKKGLKRPEMAIRFPAWATKVWNKKPRGAIGANLAIPRSALLAVNGFDADYEGYGMEETDLVWRLRQYGLKTQTVLGRCALYHLYHLEKEQGPEASDMFERKKLEGKIVCLNGISKLNQDKGNT